MTTTVNVTRTRLRSEMSVLARLTMQRVEAADMYGRALARYSADPTNLVRADHLACAEVELLAANGEHRRRHDEIMRLIELLPDAD